MVDADNPYVIVGASIAAELVLKVNQRLAEGYALAGNLIEFDGRLLQPMMLPSSKKRETTMKAERDR